MSAVIADILTGAADKIEQDGFWKGGVGPEGANLSEGGDCTCAGLAIIDIAYSNADDEGDASTYAARRTETFGALLAYLGIEPSEGDNGKPDLFDVAKWNDHKHRTKAEVISALRGAAVAARNGA